MKEFRLEIIEEPKNVLPSARQNQQQVKNNNDEEFGDGGLAFVIGRGEKELRVGSSNTQQKVPIVVKYSSYFCNGRPWYI
mmetsp:Transcript_24002/g.39698  ORF Transcript_24002/g.39698 Transcript_24002/m.39698 type:complete len:80 (-) Transcript_24002:531-770(-)